MTRMMEALAGVPQVLLLTIEAPVDWIGANNSLIYDTAANYANVSLLDWAGLNDSCPGDCFYDDGYHLRPDGQVFYAALIGEPSQPPPDPAHGAPTVTRCRACCDSLVVQRERRHDVVGATGSAILDGSCPRSPHPGWIRSPTTAPTSVGSRICRGSTACGRSLWRL